MIEYRKKKEGNKETFILFGTELAEPGFRGFVFNLFEIPFLATSTRRCFDSVMLYRNFPLNNDMIDQVLNCTDGWEKISKENYDEALDEALTGFKNK